MGPLFESPQTIIEVRPCSPWPDMAPTRKQEVGDLNRTYSI